MSKAAIFSFLPFLSWVSEEGVEVRKITYYYLFKAFTWVHNKHGEGEVLQEQVPRDHRKVDQGTQAGLQGEQVGIGFLSYVTRWSKTIDSCFKINLALKVIFDMICIDILTI